MLRTLPRQVEQVFLNLLLNAEQATTPGRLIAVSVEPKENRMEVSFSDDGVGIPKENLDKIFQPLFTTKPLGYGTGLGLASVWKILASLGGKIDVESRVGEGTTMRIVLPTVREIPQVNLAAQQDGSRP